ncbi:ferredoxin [Pseudonocardia sp. GCM10023141]|uniref:ferredoxin n=1 Tax=Pseudonocardia sp. GCM10023141 TaxID=3252653 RepID=UPI00361438D9
MRVEVDTSRCVGAGLCVGSAPEVFDQRDSDGMVVLLVATPPAERDAAVREAAFVCPAEAISVVDE